MQSENDAQNGITPEALAAMGATRTVYVREMGKEEIAELKDVASEIKVEGIKLYSVHAHDGTRMAVLDNRDAAFAAARQYEMEPVSVH